MPAGEETNARATAFLARAQNQFAILRQAGRTEVSDFLIAGLRLRVEAPGGPLRAALRRALAPLATPVSGRAALSVAMWDGESTGPSDLSPDWGASDYGAHGLIEGFNDARYHTAIQFEPLALRMLDRTEGQAVYWARSAREWPVWERGAPLRPLLHEWLRGCGRLPVHGAAVGRGDGGVFLAGAGGSGKSNVALACLDSELFYLSDDFCVLSESSVWQAHMLYSTGKMAAGDLARHPALVQHVSNPGAPANEKALFYLHEGFGERLIHTMPLHAIIMPHVVGTGPSTIHPADQGAAQRAIAMSTIELSRWTGSKTFPEVARFVRAMPCYTLRVGGDLPRVPALIADLLSRPQLAVDGR